MTRIGRNAPCPCGSGKKYKRCCGDPLASGQGPEAPSAEYMAHMQLELARREAREHQRRLMQGLGRPIISFENGGYRVVCIGNQVRWSKTWRTFADFLLDYLKITLTPEWGNAELKKPESERHPLLHWYQKVCLFQQAQARNADGIYRAEMTGAVKAYLGLAYDLYLCAHNAELPELLLKRLRNRQTFEGALYEASVIGCLAKAGFLIELEDETDSTRSHCELTATHKDTGRKFSVEAKAVASTNPRAGASADPPRIRGKLYDALCKRADHERTIFIELNRAGSVRLGEVPDWAARIDAEMALAENDLTVAGQPAPPAYVMVTNRAFVHALDDAALAEVGLACGFKIPDFASRTGARRIIDLVRAREKHRELHWLRKALQKHDSIPSTFDDRLPEETEDEAHRLRIGTTYLVPDERGEEMPGVLTDAVVLEPERKVYGTYRLQDGRHIICAAPLSDAELAAYRRSPETFFGVIKHVSAEVTEPLDCFDFFWDVYSKSTREKLLEFTAGWIDAAVLSALPQKELAEVYCARLAEDMWQRHVQHLTTRPAA